MRCLLFVIAVTCLPSGPSWAKEEDDAGLAPLVQVLREIDDAAVQSDLLTGMREGLKGRKSVPMPAGWREVYPALIKSQDATVREHARALAIMFDDAQAIKEMQALVNDRQADAAERCRAMDALSAKQVAGFSTALQKLLDDPTVRAHALRGLASFADTHTPEIILAHYTQLTSEEKQDAITTLAARKEFAFALLAAIESQQIPRGDVSSFTARQLASLGDAKLNALVKEVWGDARDTPQDKLDKIARFKTLLTTDHLAKADLAAGRKVFQKTCQQCHVLYGEGAKIGPDLTGSNRSNLEYVLTNVIDPSAAIAKEYKMNILITTDGRVLTGMIVEKSGERLTLQTVNERVTVVQEDIDTLQESPLSMMPEGQLEQLTAEQIRDLVAYLATKQQVE